MTDLISSQAVAAFIQVILIDLVLAGDNALVIGIAAAGLPPQQRRRAIAIGILTATALRILCAAIATQLLQVLGLLLAGGILLLWVCWKMWREIQTAAKDQDRGDERLEGRTLERNPATAKGPRRKTFGQVVLRIVVADVSMSLDNVLAIAGAARASLRPRLWSGPLHCVDGRRRQPDKPTAPEAPLDRLSRAGDYSLCGWRDDLSWRLRPETAVRRGRMILRR